MITVRWGAEDKSILHYEFEGSWTIEDLIEALDAGVAVTEKYDHDIDVIVDLEKTGWPRLIGTDVNGAFKRAMNRSEEHIDAAKGKKEPGVIVIASNNPIIRNSLTTMMSLYNRLGDQVALANNLNEAYSVISNFRLRTRGRLSA